jgi:hypothetical protein
MKLTIQRTGGMLPALRPTAVHEVEALPAAQQQALLAWLSAGSGAGQPPPRPARVQKAPHAEAMSYVFTLESGEKLSAAFADVPEPLRALLPAATAIKKGRWDSLSPAPRCRASLRRR